MQPGTGLEQLRRAGAGNRGRPFAGVLCSCSAPLEWGAGGNDAGYGDFGGGDFGGAGGDF